MMDFKRVLLLFFLLINSSLFGVLPGDAASESPAADRDFLQGRASRQLALTPLKDGRLLTTLEPSLGGGEAVSDDSDGQPNPEAPSTQTVDLSKLSQLGDGLIREARTLFITKECLLEEANRQDWQRKINSDSLAKKLIDKPRYWLFEASYWLNSSKSRGLKRFKEGEEKIEEEGKNKSFLQPKYIVPAVAGLSAVSYYGYKKFKNRNNKNYLQPNAFENVEKIAAWSGAITIFVQNLKEAGFNPIAALMPFLIEAICSEPKLLEQDILETGFSFTDLEPRFQNAWLFLLRSIFVESGEILNLSPHLIRSASFFVDLIYPIYQFWLLTGHLLPELNVYLRDNILRHSIKYTVKQFLKFNKAKDGLSLVKLTSMVLLKYKVISPQVMQKSEIAKVYYLFGEGMVDMALDLLLNSMLGEKSKYADVIMKFAKNNLRKVDLLVDDQPFKVEIKSDGFKDLKSVAVLIQQSVKILGAYEEYSQNIEYFRKLKAVIAERAKKLQDGDAQSYEDGVDEVAPTSA